MTAPVDALAALAALAAAAGAATIARDVHSLLERVRGERFFVACLGQFKRGKSTLLNALLGEPVLPSGVAPVTSVVTVVRHGPRRARVRLGEQGWREIEVSDLADYVAEGDNPENRKGVTAVEVYCPSPLLARGLCLVDTPGIGSVFAGNTAETRAFVPQIDAALVVLGGDPPISGEELGLLEEVGRRVGDVVLVLNKSDRLSEAERAEARAFTEAVLHQRVPTLVGALYEVSARERLEGRGPARDWAALVGRIEELSAAGERLVRGASRRGFGALATRLRGHLREELDALRRPVEETERRLVELRRCVADAQRSVSELGHLFNAEQQRLAAHFDEERVRFVERAVPAAKEALAACVAAAPGSKVRQVALDRAREVAERAVAAWMEEQTLVVEREFAGVTARFVGHANALLDGLRASGQLPAGALAAPVVLDATLRAPSRYYFLASLPSVAAPGAGWMDALRTDTAVRAASLRAATQFAEWLLQLNANRVAGDLDERVVESRRRVEGALRRSLEEIATTAEEAASRARAARERGEGAVKQAVEAVEGRLAELDAIEAESA